MIRITIIFINLFEVINKSPKLNKKNKYMNYKINLIYKKMYKKNIK